LLMLVLLDPSSIPLKVLMFITAMYRLMINDSSQIKSLGCPWKKEEKGMLYCQNGFYVFQYRIFSSINIIISYHHSPNSLSIN
jgi:hypothetical protein